MIYEAVGLVIFVAVFVAVFIKIRYDLERSKRGMSKRIVRKEV